MTAEPAWCLFRVQPQDSIKVKKAFNAAIKQSKVSQKLQAYLQSRRLKSSTSRQLFQEALSEFYPQALPNISDLSDLVDWEDLHNTFHLFFPEAFRKMLDRLFRGANPIMSSSMEASTIDLLTSHDFGAGQVLYAGLGWERASRLPGCCGNMFISPEELGETLIEIEQVFREVDEADFFARACAAGTGEYCDLEEFFLFPLALSKILKEGNGLLALNHPHMGSLPFLETEFCD